MKLSAEENFSELSTELISLMSHNTDTKEMLTNITETKTILLIGGSRKGKSALANVLLNKNGNLEEVFKESFGSVSETKKIQFEKFEENNTNYLVINTPSIGDTQMSDKEKLDIISEIDY